MVNGLHKVGHDVVVLPTNERHTAKAEHAFRQLRFPAADVISHIELWGALLIAEPRPPEA